MASALVSSWLCEPCIEDGKEIQARTQCYECHELLCEPCSDYHLRLKRSKNHHLIELVQFWKKPTPRHDQLQSKQTSTLMNEDELASDFLEHVTLTENTILYRGAQFAIQSTTSEPRKRTISKEVGPGHMHDESFTPSKRLTKKHVYSVREDVSSFHPNIATPSKRTITNQTDPRRMKLAKCLEFSVKRTGEKGGVWVRGLLCVLDYLVIIDNKCGVLKLFDKGGSYLSSTELRNNAYGITLLRDRKFATCVHSNTVYLWKIRGQRIVSKNVYHVDYRAHGINYNGMYYCVLHRDDNAVTILGRHGRQIRKINMKEAFRKEFTFGFDIHMDSDTNNIYVPCEDEFGVLCMTAEGRALWFTSLSRPWGITEMQGKLCVTDVGHSCLHMITKEGEYIRKLLDQENLDGKPNYACYGQDDKLYVSYYSHDKISVYTVT